MMTLLLALACTSGPSNTADDNGAATNDKTVTAAPTPVADTSQWPVFTFGWSEYPSWSAFWAMHKAGMLNGEQGQFGEFEKAHHVDIVLVECEYSDCITKYGAGNIDFVALTNLDTITTGVPSVGVFPTSTSAGGDQLWVSNDITTLEQLRDKHIKVHGLAGSVSEYMFRRNVTLAGLNQADFIWIGEDPKVVTQHMVDRNADYQAGVVWNPYGLELRKARPDDHALVTSKPIGGEIVDMVVASEATWAKPGAHEAALTLADAYYAFNDRLEGPQRNDLLVATGEKFGASDVVDMEIAVSETKFYGTPAQGLAVWDGQKLKDTMPIQVQFVVDTGIVTGTPPLFSFGPAVPATAAGQSYLRFDSSTMQALANPPAAVAGQ